MMSAFDDWWAETGGGIYGQEDGRASFNAGRATLKAEVLALLSSCLDRDPSLQKLVRQIEDL
jgi:hypothetical protein